MKQGWQSVDNVEGAFWGGIIVYSLLLCLKFSIIKNEKSHTISHSSSTNKMVDSNTLWKQSLAIEALVFTQVL